MTGKFLKCQRSKGFTLLEAVITVSIMGILAAVVTPTYLDIQLQAKLAISEANSAQIRQAFINLYLEAVLDDEEDPWPAEPADNRMTSAWASSTILYNGRNVNQLFNESQIAYNPYGNPFLYFRLAATEQEQAGFRIDDPDTGISQSFRP